MDETLAFLKHAKTKVVKQIKAVELSHYQFIAVAETFREVGVGIAVAVIILTTLEKQLYFYGQLASLIISLILCYISLIIYQKVNHD